MKQAPPTPPLPQARAGLGRKAAQDMGAALPELEADAGRPETARPLQAGRGHGAGVTFGQAPAPMSSPGIPLLLVGLASSILVRLANVAARGFADKGRSSR